MTSLENAYEIQAFAILDLASSCQFGLNDAGTCAKIDTRLTQPGSLSVRMVRVSA
jgi:hypothetical protein